MSYGGARILADFSCTVTGDLARGSRSGVGLGWPINCSVGSLLLLLCGPAIFSLVQLLAASATCWDLQKGDFPFLIQSSWDPLFPPGRKGGTPMLMQQLEFELCFSSGCHGLFYETPDTVEQCEQQHIEK